MCRWSRKIWTLTPYPYVPLSIKGLLTYLLTVFMRLSACLHNMFVARWMTGDKPPVSAIQFRWLAEKPQVLQRYGVCGTEPKGYDVLDTEPKSFQLKCFWIGIKKKNSVLQR